MSTVVAYGACLVVGFAMGWVCGIEFYRWQVRGRYMRRLERAAELMERRTREREGMTPREERAE